MSNNSSLFSSSVSPSTLLEIPRATPNTDNAMSANSTLSAISITSTTTATASSTTGKGAPSTTGFNNYVIQPTPSYNCAPLNSTGLITNTTSTADGVAVKVSCSDGYQLAAIQNGHSDIFKCLQGIWNPTTPRCTLLNTSQIPIGIIVGCTVGAGVCLLIILFALYMMHRNNKDNKLRKEKDKLKNAKMMHMNYFMTAFQERDETTVTVLPSASTSGYGSTEHRGQVCVDETSMNQSHSMSSLTEVEITKDTDSASSVGDSASMFEKNINTADDET